MSIEVKGALLKALSDHGEGEALFALWAPAEDADGDVTERGFFGSGQEVFMVPHHLWTSGQPPLAKGTIYEERIGAVYRFKMNLATDQGRNWHQHLLFDLREGEKPRQVWSYGFRLKEGGFTPRGGGFKGRRLHAAADGSPGAIVIEVSPVTAAAQPLSRTLTAKTDGPRLTPEQRRQVEALYRKHKSRWDARAREEQLELKKIRLRFLQRQIEMVKKGIGV
jgi:hypothetical protein